jgi:hypothetical protein
MLAMAGCRTFRSASKRFEAVRSGRKLLAASIWMVLDGPGWSWMVVDGPWMIRGCGVEKVLPLFKASQVGESSRRCETALEGCAQMYHSSA